MFSCNVIEE